MFKIKPFPFSLVVLIVLIAVHLLSSYFSWYWSFPWMSIVVHILGGMWVGSIFLWLATYLNQINSMLEYKTKSLLIALVASALFGILWELAENLTGTTFINDAGYSLNTATDLLCDVIGGIIAYLYFIKRKNNKNVIHQPIMVDDAISVYNKIGLINHDRVQE